MTGALDFSWGNYMPGRVKVAEIATLWDLTAQPDAFRLATLHFTPSAAGASTLELALIGLSDEAGAFFGFLHSLFLSQAD